MQGFTRRVGLLPAAVAIWLVGVLLLGVVASVIERATVDGSALDEAAWDWGSIAEFNAVRGLPVLMAAFALALGVVRRRLAPTRARALAVALGISGGALLLLAVAAAVAADWWFFVNDLPALLALCVPPVLVPVLADSRAQADGVRLRWVGPAARSAPAREAVDPVPGA